ncbi:hypothetical protein WJX84_011511 [Apatococcus fuscideae]|uniref:Uncharacterized protein n=1 Tax=Apatococcus fuscideae TaxID=2026836 RepID=A0AAW1T5L3_9CHLO
MMEPLSGGQARAKAALVYAQLQELGRQRLSSSPTDKDISGLHKETRRNDQQTESGQKEGSYVGVPEPADYDLSPLLFQAILEATLRHCKVKPQSKGLAHGQLTNPQPAQPKASATAVTQPQLPGQATQSLPDRHHQQQLEHGLASSQATTSSGSIGTTSEAQDGCGLTQDHNQQPQALEVDGKAAAKGADGASCQGKALAGTYSQAPESAEAGAGLSKTVARPSAAETGAEGTELDVDCEVSNDAQDNPGFAADLQPGRSQMRQRAGNPDPGRLSNQEAVESRGAGPNDSRDDPNGYDQNELWPYYRSSRESTSQDEALPFTSLQGADRADEAARRLTGSTYQNGPYRVHHRELQICFSGPRAAQPMQQHNHIPGRS